MKKLNIIKAGAAGIILSGALLGALAPCVSYADDAHVVISGQPVAPILQDDYVYYPSYGIYYNPTRHQYAYQKGNAWVNEPAPHGVSVEALKTAPSVKMDFHDSPARHHADIVKKYPKDWKPAASSHDERGK
jgi:hypothetical protein